MSANIRDWRAGLVIALLAGASAATACGGDDSMMDDDGAAGDTGTGGDSSDGDTGGTSSDGGSDGDGGSDTGGMNGDGGSSTGGAAGGTGGGGSGGDGGGGGTGGSGGGNATGSIDDLIGAICEWEFGCCSEGELSYRLGAEGSSVEECTDFFSFQFNENNNVDNPFPGGTATGLLGTLGYTVDPARVTENAQGIGDCIAEWEAKSCPMLSGGDAGVAYCEETVMPGTGACELINLFDPALEVGDQCTIGLAEGATNDVECPAGSTCLSADDPDNPADFPACVQRSTDGQPCTSDVDCDYNFYCNDSGDCVEKGDAGDTCSFNNPDMPLPGEEDIGCKAGLKCSPSDLTCVANCNEGYPCQVNSECPAEHACVPVTIGDDADNWKMCRPLGTTQEDNCDDDTDCLSDRYCSGGTCAADEPDGDECTRDEMCEAGTFCDRAERNSDGSARTPPDPPVCAVDFEAGGSCYPKQDEDEYSTGCDPAGASLCLSTHDENDELAEYECKSELKGANSRCEMGFSECQPGLTCELNTGDTDPTCVGGASEGSSCDDNYGDNGEISCAPGLTCLESTSTCVAQRAPGADCEHPTTPGDGLNDLCLNFDCVENWRDGETQPEFVCSDAPIPESNGGDNLTCGGT